MMRRSVLMLLAVTLSATSSHAALPVQPGEAVVTSGSSDITFDTDFVVRIFDVRDPGCDPRAQLGLPWPAPVYRNAMPNPTMNPADEWTVANLGDVFGIAIDDGTPPNIYVTSSSVSWTFCCAPGTGEVFRLDGTTGAISALATLPNNSVGLGNIAFAPTHQLLYVTNHEDGRIYRLDLSGMVLDTFDPFAADDGLPGFAPLGERLWGSASTPTGLTSRSGARTSAGRTPQPPTPSGRWRSTPPTARSCRPTSRWR